MSDFFQEYFVNPILYQDKYAPYNVYNTAAYAAIAIAAVYLLYRYLTKKGIAIDGAFVKSVLPFVVFGSALRISEDSHFLPRVVQIGGMSFFPFVTPGIYILTFILIGLTWVIAKKTSKTHEEFCSKSFKTGVVLAAIAFLLSANSLLQAKNPFGLITIFAVAIAVWFAFKKIWQARGLKTTFAEEAMVFGQALDGGATFVGVQFLGYSEQHVVGNAIFSLFGGPWAFLLIKILFVLAVVELLRRENIQENEKNYIMLLITILGLGPGLRDTLRIFAGV